MRYDENEELEATGEWLLRINSAGFSEELTYVPSYLSKVGVAPVDVVDRLDWLRDHDRIDARASLAGRSSAMKRAPSSVVVLERPEIIEEDVELASTLLAQAEVDPLTRSMEPLVFTESSVLNYDGYGLWEWAGPIEKTLEESFKLLLTPEPGLHEFNGLASLTRLVKRTRGKRARYSARSTA